MDFFLEIDCGELHLEAVFQVTTNYGQIYMMEIKGVLMHNCKLSYQNPC